MKNINVENTCNVCKRSINIGQNYHSFKACWNLRFDDHHITGSSQLDNVNHRNQHVVEVPLGKL